MDYEKKYKEALERVRRLHDRMRVLSSTDALVASSELEFIFPELAESEDERIRKELKEAFEAYDIESKWNGIPIRSIFAWLEKQKEPENTSASTMAPSCWEVEQKEQKPAWSEEDEKTLDDAYCWLCEYAGSLMQKNYGKSFMLYGIAEKLKSLRPQYHGDVTMTEAYKMGLEAGKASSWKPSEEQIEALVAATLRYQSTGLESLYEDLKKLKYE